MRTQGIRFYAGTNTSLCSTSQQNCSSVVHAFVCSSRPPGLSWIHSLQNSPFHQNCSCRDHEWLSSQYCGQFSVIFGLDFQYHLKQVTVLYSCKYHVLLLVFLQPNLLFFPLLFAGFSSSSWLCKLEFTLRMQSLALVSSLLKLRLLVISCSFLALNYICTLFPNSCYWSDLFLEL